MVLETLKEAWGMVRRFPLLILVGLAAGILAAMTVIIQVYSGLFFAERVTVLEMLVLPFFIGGAMQVVHTQDGSLSTFIGGGKKFYFRILLATLVIVFAALVTMLALVIPLTLLGFGMESGLLPFTLLGVFVPLVYFTLFYDAAAVVEDRKVLDSLRRSVEFVTLRGFSVLLFLLVNLLILAGVGIVLLFIWSILFASSLEPLAMNLTLGETIAPDAIIAALGPTGMVITSIFYLIGIAITVTLFYAYKTTYFKRYAGGVGGTAPPMVGEYDEKGRWYRY